MPRGDHYIVGIIGGLKFMIIMIIYSTLTAHHFQVPASCTSPPPLPVTCPALGANNVTFLYVFSIYSLPFAFSFITLIHSSSPHPNLQTLYV